MKFNLLEKEYWYGGYVHQGTQMPVGGDEERVIDLTYNKSPNQEMPLFVSSKGRYIWCEEGFKITFSKGSIETDRPVLLKEGYDNLRGAYLEAMRNHFPFNKITLDDALFEGPIYNSWIELTFNQNQADILKYANSILENHMPPGVIMIDDGWSDYYGKWTFNKDKFPDAEGMIKTLNEMGFKVMLWVCPFITPDTKEFRYARDHKLLIENEVGKPKITEWWNGYSATLDFTKEEASKWLEDQLNALMDMGIAGFKFDAGDSCYYDQDGDKQSLLWAKLGEKYPLNEFRVTFKAGGMSLLQRLCDKHHSWDESGIKGLIPGSLAQGITGHPFCSPDMIGGGEYLNFWSQASSLDEELFVRHSEIACLMPGMQFSAAPWRVLSEESFKAIQETLATRAKYEDYLLKTISESKTSGEPVLRYMEYVFPGEGFEKVNNQFMVGDKLLVAPIEIKGESSRLVHIPSGNWLYEGEVIVGDGTAKVLRGTLGRPIVLERQ